MPMLARMCMHACTATCTNMRPVLATDTAMLAATCKDRQVYSVHFMHIAEGPVSVARQALLEAGVGRPAHIHPYTCLNVCLTSSDTIPRKTAKVKRPVKKEALTTIHAAKFSSRTCAAAQRTAHSAARLMSCMRMGRAVLLIAPGCADRVVACNVQRLQVRRRHAGGGAGAPCWCRACG